jgi:chorismate mutase
MSEPTRTKVNVATGATLAELRAEIDRIDAEIHARLIERGEIIGRLIDVKRAQESGSAFRPAREAEMMRRLVERHRGILPLDTVESIWRVVIATFTHIQAPYTVHADFSAGDAAVRDSARFHFGFTVPLQGHRGARAIVAAVAASRGDLGLVPASALAGAGAWWTELEPSAAPKIIARLPFVERADHPASLPLFVISRPVVADAAANEVTCWSLKVSGWKAAVGRAIAPLCEFIAEPEGRFDGAALLLSLPQGRSLAEVRDALVAAGASVRGEALVGGHATRYTVAPGGAAAASGAKR